MEGIPPALDTDVEDVVWALQTADTLWKRNERGDALVWLRRAAQAAGEANDDDRALALARGAAELTESMSQAPEPPTDSAGASPPAPARPSSGSPGPGALGSARAPAPKVPIAPPPSAPPPPAPLLAPVIPEAPPTAPMLQSQSQAPRVLTAAESHAGMLDPWADADGPKSSARTPSHRARDVRNRGPADFEEDEVVTSAKPHPARPAAPPPPPPPPPHFAPAPPPLPALDLSCIDAFGDVPDDVRARFATAASVRVVARGEEIPGFALAFICTGTADVLAVGVDTPATSLAAGTVLRARGTLATAIPVRLICSSDTATVATWNELDVAGVFGACPWVEDDLRAAGDRVQALAGLSLGALGRSAYDQVRPVLAERLILRALAAGEPLLREADPVHGLFLVGCGDVELSSGDDATTTLAAGSFVFPSQTLSFGRAPMTARAGSGGAIVLLADRSTTQELLVTQPLLLELLSG